MSENPFAAPSFRDDLAESQLVQHHPGIGRSTFFGLCVVLNMAAGIVLEFVAPHLTLPDRVAEFCPLIILILLAVPRMDNLGYSRWWALGLLVPVLNVLVLLRCLAAPPGYALGNGLDPVGKLVSGIIVVTAILMVAGFFIAVWRTA